jgi:hypothetical protein
MGDLAETIVPKSDQLNADDLIGGPITITVRAVKVEKNEAQPCSIYYEGDNGKPYKPSKGMRRLLMMAWQTDDSQTFLGRSLTLWRNPDVMWAGKAEGGIRISHLSHMKGKEIFAITTRRGVREHITVLPLETRSVELTLGQARQRLIDAKSIDELQNAWRMKAMAPFRDDLADLLAELKSANQPVEQDSIDKSEMPVDDSLAPEQSLISLNDAKDQIDACKSVPDVTSNARALYNQLSETDCETLARYVEAKIDELKGAAK